MPTPQPISSEEADKLVLENQGWAESIARSVARAWNMDWKLDGLDGAAMEALIFCSRRFDASRGVPFRAYARKRIHEASTDAARKTRGFRRGSTSANDEARTISAELMNVFPELRGGELPLSEDMGGDGDYDARSGIRHLVVGASVIAARQSSESTNPDDLLDYKKMVEVLALLEPVHQLLMWKVYWEGESMRTLASDWEIDELNVIREHKVLLGFMLKSLSSNKKLTPPRVRPGLKAISLKLKKSDPIGCFARFTKQKIKAGPPKGGKL